MGFGGFLKGLGKGALKVASKAAPALSFVPGGNFINAGVSALDTKVNKGGSWKDALKSGLTSAAMGGLGSKIPGINKIPGLGKGLSPSSEGMKATLGGVLKQAGKDFLGSNPLETANNVRDVVGSVRGRGNNDYSPNRGDRAVSGQPSRGRRIPNYGGRMRGIGPSVLMQRDQNFPNLAEALNAGRQQAMRDQPFRGGYDIVSYGPTPEERAKMGPEIRTRTPPIGPRRRVA